MSRLSITPIGTCRINTPLRRGQARYPVEIRSERIYGFTHTSAEALQQLAYLEGERQFDAAVLPILFRPQSDGRQDQPVAPRPDLYVVEISSAKCYRVGDVAVQSNYLSRYFADFFASAPRSKRFWALAGATSASARAELDAFLAADPVYRLYGSSDRELLRSISMRTQGFDDIAADMAELAERMGKDRVVFVTHVNAHGADGTFIPARDRIIRWIRKAAAQIGVPCFDPSALMHAFGQERAMERDGLDTMHYTNAFSDRWYAHFHGEFILPRLAEVQAGDQAGDLPDPSLLASSIAATMEFDDYFVGARQLFAALANDPANPALRQLGGQVYARIGDYPNAVAMLTSLLDSPEMTTAGLLALMRAQFEIGHSAEAIALADRLLGDEYESIEIYEVASLAAERVGRMADAVRYAMLAFRLDPSQHRFAFRVLDAYHAAGEHQKLEAWRTEVLDRLHTTPDPVLARTLAEWAIGHADEASFRATAMIVARSGIEKVEPVIEEAVARGLLGAAAEVMTMVASMPDIPGRTLRKFRQIAESWSAQSQTWLEEGRTADAYALAEVCRIVLPGNATARRVERQVLQDLRVRIRDALTRGEHGEVIAMGESAGRMVYRQPEIVTAFAKALLAAGRAEEALAVAREACETLPDSVDVQALHAQIATLQGDLLTPLRLYGRLRVSSDPQVERYRPRMAKFLDKAGRTGPRLFRTLVAQAQYEQALELAALVSTHTDGGEQVAADLQKLRRVLRSAFRQLDEEEGSGEEALRILRLMLVIDGEDAWALRLAAIQAMRLQQFEAALAYWRRFDAVSPGQDSTARNIHRCEILVRRMTAARRAESKAG